MLAVRLMFSLDTCKNFKKPCKSLHIRNAVGGQKKATYFILKIENLNYIQYRYKDNMSTEKKIMYGLDASKYPARLGQPWKEEEVIKLLKSIQKKKSIEEIAKEHDRTVGGINSHIQKIAVDYHFNDKRSIEEIQKFTGLTKEQIEYAIKRHELKDAAKKSAESKVKKEKPLTMLEVVSLLKDIQSKLNTLLEKIA